MTEPIKPDDEQAAEEAAPTPPAKQSPLVGMFGQGVSRVSRWLTGILIASIGGIIGLVVIENPITNMLDNRCNSFPVFYEFIRETTCEPPIQFPTQDFVIVSSKLVGDEDVATSTIQAVGISIDAELERSEVPANLGVLHVVPSVDPWVDAAADLEGLKREAREQAELRNADIVIYGQVSQGQNIVFEPAFYVHQPIPQVITSLIDVIDPENLGVQFPILEGQSLQVVEWVQGMRAFAVGLQLTRQSTQLTTVDSTPAERIATLELALESFASVSEETDPQFYEIANLYAGNTALQIAIIEQEIYERESCPTRCVEYDPALVDRYLLAWDHYTVAARSDRDDIAIRGLIGRGNVQFRLSRITRTTESDNNTFINYNCFDDDSLYFEEDGERISDVNWIQRAQASNACFQQVIRAAEDDSIIQIKGLYGAAQTLDWLGQETRDQEAYAAAFEAYSTIIDQYEALASADENPELTCLAGYAYGQRAFIRWDSEDDRVNALDDRQRDFSTAVTVLSAAPPECMASEAIREYQNYVN